MAEDEDGFVVVWCVCADGEAWEVEDVDRGEGSIGDSRPPDKGEFILDKQHSLAKRVLLQSLKGLKAPKRSYRHCPLTYKLTACYRQS